MSNSGKQSPLGVNVLGSLLQDTGFYINPRIKNFVGSSKTNNDYTPGSIVNDTVLKKLTYALHDAYIRGQVSSTAVMTNCTIQTDSYVTTLTVGTLTSGLIKPGMVLTDLGSQLIPGTFIVKNIQGGSTSGSIWEISQTQATVGNDSGYIANIDITATQSNYTISSATYDNLLAIGQSRIAALGNSKPPTYVTADPSGKWNGQSNTGYSIGTGNTDSEQNAKWNPFLSSNDNAGITQWGWLRCIALQAWNDFNWNGQNVDQATPSYKDFTSSFITADGFVNYSNKALFAIQASKTFLQGTFSNTNDLITADISGVSLSSRAFGQDLINLGRAIDLSTIDRFGLPSALLQNINNNNAVTQNLTLAMLSAGLTQSELTDIISGAVTATKEQEQKLFGSFLVIQGVSLKQILLPLNCKTPKLESLADLLNIKKLFPISFTTLTVPIYNANPGPTNSKTYYLLYINEQLNPQLITPKIKEQVGTIVPPVEPPVVTTPPTPVEAPIPAPVAAPALASTGRSGGGGGCVALESFVPLIEREKKHNGRDITNAWMLEPEMRISLGTDNLEIVEGQVVKALNDFQPCVRIVTSDGVSLVCSTTAPIYTKEQGFIPSTEVYGKQIAVMRNGRTWFDEVVGLEDVGMKFVRVIDTGNNSFWAGEKPGSFILHHNTRVFREYIYEKK